MKPSFALLLITSAGLLSISAGAADIEWQSVESIEAVARAHAERHGARIGARQALEAGPLDPRVRLKSCPRPLTSAFAPGANTPPRMTVEVRCPGAGGWKVYVPVAVRAFDRAVVATRALERGQLLADADVAVTESEIAGLPAGYARDPAQVIGQRMARPVAAGTVLTSAALEIDPLVRRGERVTAIAQINGVAVRTQAVALATAGLDQRVRLKNPSSGKEIEGIVRGEALVEIAVR